MKKLIFMLLKLAEISLLPFAYYLFNYIYFFEDKAIKYLFFKTLELPKEVEFSFINFWLGLSITAMLALIISFFIFAAPALFWKWIYANEDWSENLSKWIKSRFSK